MALGILELDDVGADPGGKRGAGGPRLHVRHVEDADSLECFHYFFFPLAGFRLVMRPLSVPAVSSMTAFMSVGLRERMASSICFRHSARGVACTPPPPEDPLSLS